MTTQTVDSKALSDVLDVVRLAVKPSHPIAVYHNACFRGDTVAGFDGEVGVIAKSPISLHCCLPLDAMAKWVRTADGQVEITQAKNKVTLRAPGLENTLLSSDMNVFPDFFPKDVHALPNVPDLADAVKDVIFSSESKGENRPRGVGISGTHVYSTDGIRFTRRSVSGNVHRRLVLPPRAAKILAAAGNPQTLAVSEGSLIAGYLDSGTLLMLGLASYNFAFDTLDTAFDGARKSVVLQLPQEMSHAIDQVCAMAKSPDDGVQIRADGTKLTISAVYKEVGESKAELPFVSPPFEFKVNPRYFQDGLKRAPQIDLGDFFSNTRKCVRFVGTAGFDHMLAMMQ